MKEVGVFGDTPSEYAKWGKSFCWGDQAISIWTSRWQTDILCPCRCRLVHDDWGTCCRAHGTQSKSVKGDPKSNRLIWGACTHTRIRQEANSSHDGMRYIYIHSTLATSHWFLCLANITKIVRADWLLCFGALFFYVLVAWRYMSVRLNRCCDGR